MKSKFNLTNPVSLPFTLYVTMSTVLYAFLKLKIYVWVWSKKITEEYRWQKVWKFDFENLSDESYGLKMEKWDNRICKIIALKSRTLHRGRLTIWNPQRDWSKFKAIHSYSIPLSCYHVKVYPFKVY